MVKIIVKVDDSCEMAWVEDTKGNGLEGNFHDFHNGCYGHHELDEFNDMEEFIEVLKELHESNGETVKVIRKKYKY